MTETQESYNKLFIPSDGVYFDPENPDPDKMNIDTIAQGLATEFRYGGHSDPLVTVAQHAVDTAEVLRELGYDAEMQFYGLHHDSAEAYLGDAQKPNKEVTPGIDEMEEVWQEAVWEFLDVPTPTEQQYGAIKEVDYRLYLHEVFELFENGAHAEAVQESFELDDWSVDEEMPDIDELVELGTPMQKARAEFLNTHERLSNEI